MKAFAYARATTVEEALRAYASHSDSRFIGGGTNLLDLMKMGVEQPSALVDISRVPLNTIEEHEGGVRIGALVSNTDAANHPLIRQRYPVLSRAILAGASQQLRNMATMGGNLLQRTRCYYFYDPTYAECNKRVPGSGCAARSGVNRIHAILGASEECVATHPSDMCVALSALNAVVRVQGVSGNREIPFADFHRLPGATPQIETNLRAGELITHIDLPALPKGIRSHYLKVRDRNSYAFALVSVAVVMDLDTARTHSRRTTGSNRRPTQGDGARHLCLRAQNTQLCAWRVGYEHHRKRPHHFDRYASGGKGEWRCPCHDSFEFAQVAEFAE
jgi:xanthine dehydrogenase YagS FAD-binding subunit